MPTVSLQERVEQILKEQTIKPIELKTVAGVSKGLVSQWMSGQAKTMGYAAAKKISGRYGYAIEWLMKGEGDKKSGAEHKPPMHVIVEGKDELSLLDDYRRCSDLWKFTIRLLARAAPQDQHALARDMNILMTTIFGKEVKPISDERMESILRKSRQGFPPRPPAKAAKSRGVAR